jgi:hypothetical protein
MVTFYELHDDNGPIDKAPRCSTYEYARGLADVYVSYGRQGVRVDQVKTVWEAKRND